jgi:hypothetical protein
MSQERLDSSSTKRRERPVEPKTNAERPDKKRQFVLTEGAERALDGAVSTLRNATRARLTDSHFLRALFLVVRHAMPHLEEEASKIGTLKRPSNARGNEEARELFEQALAKALLAAIRSSSRSL